LRDNPEGGELDLAKVSVGAARRILLPFYTALVREQEKAVTVILFLLFN